VSPSAREVRVRQISTNERVHKRKVEKVDLLSLSGFPRLALDIFCFYTGRKYMPTHQLLLRNREEVENCGFVAVAVLLRWSPILVEPRPTIFLWMTRP
jgi:hypothetical protein